MFLITSSKSLSLSLRPVWTGWSVDSTYGHVRFVWIYSKCNPDSSPAQMITWRMRPFKLKTFVLNIALRKYFSTGIPYDSEQEGATENFHELPALLHQMTTVHFCHPRVAHHTNWPLIGHDVHIMRETNFGGKKRVNFMHNKYMPFCINSHVSVNEL